MYVENMHGGVNPDVSLVHGWLRHMRDMFALKMCCLVLSRFVVIGWLSQVAGSTRTVRREITHVKILRVVCY